jgi:tetratricopeptide (TPR) repeat protein
MAYPGNRELSIEAQDRVMSAFRKVIANLQQNQREEALIGLEFVLRIDPAFSPAVELKRQLGEGAHQVDLSDLLAQLEAPSTDALNELLVEAVEDFNNRNFISAKNKVEQVLVELPGHQEGRRLLVQIQESLKVEQQVGQFLTQAREALAGGDPQEAANFVLMAQALDPHHTGIAPTLQEIHARSGTAESFAPDPASEAGPQLGAETGATSAPWGIGDSADDLFGGADIAAEFPAASFEMEPEPPVVDRGAGLEVPVDEPDDDLADDVSDLFDAGAGSAEGAPSSDDPEIAQLLARGAAAFNSGKFLAAIDAWSRVWLEDPSYEDVGSRIEQAKKRLEQSASELQHLIFDAEDALIGGDEDKALELVERVLAKNPGHPEALALHRRLSGEPESPAPSPSAPEPEAPEMPDLDDDLFSEPFADLEPAEAERPATAFEPAFEEDEQPPAEIETPTPTKRMLAVSPRTLVVGLLGALAVVIVAWFGLRAILGGVEPTAENDVYMMRTEAEALFAQGKVGAALHLAEEFEPRQEGDDQVVAILVAKYRAALATPTPTPVPALAVEARRMLDIGLWFRAYDAARRGLESHPGDGGLLEVVDRVEGLEPGVSTLRSQLANRNHRAAVNTALDLVEAHPGQADLTEVLERSLFNAALAELRTYNLTGARSYLDQLIVAEPADDEVGRILEFIDTYKARPVDMQLKVFIQSLDERLAWSAIPEGAPSSASPEAAPADPTPTPAAAA